MTGKTYKTLPNKHYFRIGEVAEHLGVKPYVLRYWQTEFEQLDPEKSKMQQRQYSRKDVELLELVAYLLHERRYTIEGARNVLTEVKGNWKQALEAVRSGAPASTAAKAKGPSSSEKDLVKLRKKYESLERAFLKKDKDLADLKRRYQAVEKELLGLKGTTGPFFATLKGELETMLTLANQEATSGPSLQADT